MSYLETITAKEFERRSKTVREWVFMGVGVDTDSGENKCDVSIEDGELHYRARIGMRIREDTHPLKRVKCLLNPYLKTIVAKLDETKWIEGSYGNV